MEPERWIRCRYWPWK